MATDVQVCNLALTKVGAARISSLDDGGSKESRDCNAIYDLLRDEVLAAFPWTFAAARASLARFSDEPGFGYAYAYQLPDDCLRPLHLSSRKMPYKVEGETLLTDDSVAELHYIKRVTNPAKFTSPFVATLAARLAVDLAISVVQKAGLRDQLLREYEGKVFPSMTALDASSDNEGIEYAESYLDARE